MKENRVKRSSSRRLAAAFAAVLLVLAAIGAVIGYGKLREIYLAQCVITDMSAQVAIRPGAMVHPANIAEGLGLKVGANLATIDFDRKRRELMKEIPNIRDLRISRTLPDKVSVVVEERTPFAKLNIRGNRATTGKVVDANGVVFYWQRGTQTLPTIRETSAPGTPKGETVTGRVRAALRLLEACREPGFTELAVLEVDVSKPDFLVATLATYARVKIAWEGMDEPQTPVSRADLLARLTNLVKAIRSKVAPETTVWNATMPDRIFADNKDTL